MWTYYYNESSLDCSPLDILDDEYPMLAGPKSNSRQKVGPHIDLPFFPTLSISCTVSCKTISYKRDLNQVHHSILTNVFL